VKTLDATNARDAAQIVAGRPLATWIGGGQIIFEHLCKLRLEGIVAKRADLPYQAGRSKRWLKIRNRATVDLARARGLRRPAIVGQVCTHAIAANKAQTKSVWNVSTRAI
jgi:hypothetical protein